jgi:hypothetical protein
MTIRVFMQYNDNGGLLMLLGFKCHSNIIN